jgi:hypothetical protein
VTVAGQAFDTFVVERRSTFTGAESGQRTQRWWFSPELAVPLRWEDQVTGSRSGASYSGRISASVNALPPAAPSVAANDRTGPAAAPAHPGRRGAAADEGLTLVGREPS